MQNDARQSQLDILYEDCKKFCNFLRSQGTKITALTLLLISIILVADTQYGALLVDEYNTARTKEADWYEQLKLCLLSQNCNSDAKVLFNSRASQAVREQYETLTMIRRWENFNYLTWYADPEHDAGEPRVVVAAIRITNLILLPVVIGMLGYFARHLSPVGRKIPFRFADMLRAGLVGFAIVAVFGGFFQKFWGVLPGTAFAFFAGFDLAAAFKALGAGAKGALGGVGKLKLK